MSSNLYVYLDMAAAGYGSYQGRGVAQRSKGSHHGRKAAYLWSFAGRGGGGLTNYVPFGVIFRSSTGTIFFIEILAKVVFDE